jgi:hypothetical protein
VDDKMGLFSDLLSSITGSSSDPKATQITHDGEEIRVRNTDVIIDHEQGKHDTVWSNTTVNVNTGQSSFDEGAHGPNFKQ